MVEAEWWSEFKIFRDRDGRYYWRLEAASGRIIAQSGHPYESKYWCEQDVNWLRANAGLIRVYDYARGNAPSYYMHPQAHDPDAVATAQRIRQIESAAPDVHHAS